MNEEPGIQARWEGGIERVPIASINWIEARGDHALLHTDHKTFELRQTMTELAEVLPAEHFVRVHRSYIVRIIRVHAIRAIVRGGYELTMHDGTKVPTGRTYRELVRDTFRVA